MCNYIGSKITQYCIELIDKYNIKYQHIMLQYELDEIDSNFPFQCGSADHQKVTKMIDKEMLAMTGMR